MDKRAAKLLELLEDHVTVQWHWEQHWSTASNNGFSGMSEETRGEKAAYQRQVSLMYICSASGFKYEDLLDMIPGPFKTTHADREAILADLREYAEKKYG